MSYTFSTRGAMATIATALTFAVMPVAAQTISQPNNGVPLLGFLGTKPHYSATVGQSFVAVGSFLNSFTFWLSNDEYSLNAGQLTFQASVMEWDGSGVTGPLLYSSTVQSGPSGLSQAYAFNTGALAVTNGGSYMAFLTVPDMGPFSGSATIDGSLSSSSGGMQFFNFTNNDVNAIVIGGSAGWGTGGPTFQSAFEASFSASETTVPEPTTGILMGAGLVGLVLAARRRHA